MSEKWPTKTQKKQSFAHRLYTGDFQFDFIKHRPKWYAFSAVVLLVSILALGFRGLNLGIEFTGGSDFRVAGVSNTDGFVQRATEVVRDTGGQDTATVTLIGGDTLRVNTAGFYRVSYHVNTTAALLVGTRLVINSANVPQSTIPPIISVSQFYNEIEVGLTAGSTIQLQIYATLLGVATLLGGGVGASLMLIRLS